jgi:hypothetical protein
MREMSVGDIVLIPPIGEAAACPAFVAGSVGAPVRLTGPGPFALNVGTLLDVKPAVNGFVAPGAAVDVPAEGSKGFAPELVAEPGTDTLVPVGFVGVNPA